MEVAMSISFTWLGHAAFSLDISTRKILLDPFLTGNPLAAAKADEVEADYILVSHAHADHVGDTIDIARRTGAVVVCNNEMANWFIARGLEPDRVLRGNTGGTIDCGFFQAKLTIAHHSSSFPDGAYGGQPNGFIITAEDRRLYFAGDTALFLEMQLIGDEGVDVAFLPIGDLFTMGLSDSLLAVKFVHPRLVVPMHYNTFPFIVQDVTRWADRVNRDTMTQPIVIDPGQTYTIE